MKEERIFKLFFALGVTLVVVPLLFASILIVAPQYSAVEIDDVNVVSFEKKQSGGDTNMKSSIASTIVKPKRWSFNWRAIPRTARRCKFLRSRTLVPTAAARRS